MKRRRKSSGVKGSSFLPAQSPVRQWSTEDVTEWLKKTDFPQYCDLFSQNKINGEILLSLEENDLRTKPLELPCLGDIKRLHWAIQSLVGTSALGAFGSGSGEFDLPAKASDDSQQSPSSNQTKQLSKSNPTTTSQNASKHSRSSKPDRVVSQMLQTWPSWFPFGETKQGLAIMLPQWNRIEPLSSSLAKLFFSFSFILFVALVTSFVMTIVGDRVPDQSSYPPLPDIFLDSIPLIPIAFPLAESIILCEGVLFLGLLISHRHRMVILRRFFAITATVFLLRCATMFITSLSVPGKHLDCRKSPQVDGEEFNWDEKFARAWEIFTGFGMSINGVRTCGDYMFSGHTSILTILNFFVLEYTSANWRGLHIFSWLLNMFGMFFVLAAHEHYSIDVFMAYYLSSHMFLHYHNLANSMHLVKGEFHTVFPLFGYLEDNTKGVVPNEWGI